MSGTSFSAKTISAHLSYNCCCWWRIFLSGVVGCRGDSWLRHDTWSSTHQTLLRVGKNGAQFEWETRGSVCYQVYDHFSFNLVFLRFSFILLNAIILWLLFLFFQLIRNNIRGELTVAHTREQFSLKDNSFIAAVASSLQISSSKVIIFLVTVFPRIYAHVLVSAPPPTPRPPPSS